MSQVTGLIPGMKREEEVPDVAPQEGEYQEYTVGNFKQNIFLSTKPEIFETFQTNNKYNVNLYSNLKLFLVSMR